MRDYAAISKRLRMYSENCVAYKLDADFADAVSDAADAIEELLDELTTIRKQLPHWISVEERLPEESGYTIVFCADGERRNVTFAKYQKTPKRWELTGARSYWRVLRWMSLPEPPKGVE